MDTWRVNSYGYPNPFVEAVGGGQQQAANAGWAWDVFASFEDGASYSALKQHWQADPSRSIEPHTVESWKAAFEEFGLLFVLRGDDTIHVTPGGSLLRAAAESGNKDDFAWVGLNLLLRYPVRGEPGRRPSGIAFADSDLLLYWLLLAALVELDGLWHSELFRILSKASSRASAVTAVDAIRLVRAGGVSIENYDDPSKGSRGGVYNALNQVMVHGSLSHMLFTSARASSPYFSGETENKWQLRPAFRDLVSLALGGASRALPAGCAVSATLLDRMPAAPEFADEQEHFNYAGRGVTPLEEAYLRASKQSLKSVEFGGGTAYAVDVGDHVLRVGEHQIAGPIEVLCVLSPGARVITSDDLEATYIVEDKSLESTGAVVVRLRRARPIVDRSAAQALFSGGPHAASK